MAIASLWDKWKVPWDLRYTGIKGRATQNKSPKSAIFNQIFFKWSFINLPQISTTGSIFKTPAKPGLLLNAPIGELFAKEPVLDLKPRPLPCILYIIITLCLVQCRTHEAVAITL